MSSIASIKCHTHNDYCSQHHIPPPPIRGIEEGVDLVKSILEKDLLCRHDVQDIHTLYQAIDRLERTVEPLPDRNSLYLLKEVIDKVKLLFQSTAPQDLITLYHLQNFSGLAISQRCIEHFSQIPRNQALCKAIARHLPCCSPLEHFDQAVESLMGNCSERGVEVDKVLKEKRQHLQDITDRQSDLTHLRSVDPQNYPSYLDTVLDYGCIHLYDHMIQMRALPDRNSRRAHIDAMSFSELAHVVLETRRAIIQTVKSSIPKERGQVLFLLGATGAGKSTSLSFLRGDTMVLTDFRYDSTRPGLIGHDGATSETFFPNVDTANDWTFVDFPGFDDTNGLLISLGMECALKALVAEYHPRILILEAITNTEGKYQAAADLGLRLQRLFGENKRHCILGITKYSKDPHYAQLRGLEENQRKARNEPSEQEKTLSTEIKMLRSLNSSEYRLQIEVKETELKKEQEAREALQSIPLAEIQEKLKVAIKSNEDQLLKQVGLRQMIPFAELTDHRQLDAYMQGLSCLFSVTHVNPQHFMNPDDNRCISERFQDNLIPLIEAKKDYSGEAKNIEEFEQQVLDSSLVHTILFHSHPEVGQFLHLPEIDPCIVCDFDKQIVQGCMEKCIEDLLVSLDMKLIDKIIAAFGPKVSQDKVIELQTQKERVQNYLLGLLGELPDNPAGLETAWDNLVGEYKQRIDWRKTKVQEEWTLPTWAMVFLAIPVIPYALYVGARSHAVRAATTRYSKQQANTYVSDYLKLLESMHDSLIRLKGIENLITARDSKKSKRRLGLDFETSAVS